MSRLSNFPGENDEEDEAIDENQDDSGPVLDVNSEECSGSDFELRRMLNEVAKRVGNKEVAFKVRFEPGKVTAVKLSFLDAEKVQITTREFCKNSFERRFMLLPLTEEALDSNRERTAAPEIGIVRTLLRLLKQSGN